MRPTAIDHCVIAVTDWDRSNAFYRNVLGAEIEQKDEWHAWYRFGNWSLSVHGPEFEGLNAAKPVKPGNSDLCFVWPGTIDEALEHLRRNGVEIEQGPLDRPDGPHVYFRDPDGSLLEFVARR
jgi:catechol 2,3-dioxygenase-like lactoylglutathione lyase family enzyme